MFSLSMMDIESMEDDDESNLQRTYTATPYGFIPCGLNLHTVKSCYIQAVTFNNKTREYAILDSRGISCWIKNLRVGDTTKRMLEYEGYQTNVLREIIFSRNLNLYFAISKVYEIKVYSLTFMEVFCKESDGTTISSLLFNERKNSLIAVGRKFIRFWKYRALISGKNKPGLMLECEFPTPEASVVAIGVFDEQLQRLFILCDYDIYSYDTTGNIIFKLTSTSSMYLSACAYSIQANYVVAGSLNGQIHIFSPMGGLITTLLNHTRTVTALFIHPHDDHMFISSSMDGTIKLFSLDLLEELYSINVFSEGVQWMKLQSSHKIFCASQLAVQVYDINYTFKFWTTVRCDVRSINITSKQADRSTQVIAYAIDHSIRVHSKKNGQRKCTVLPPPELSTTDVVLSSAYDRRGRVIYILFSTNKLWVYSLRTDPATRVATWNIIEIIEKYIVDNEIKREKKKDQFGKSSFSIFNTEDEIFCHCLAVISRADETLNKEDQTTSTTTFGYLLCGMSDGTIYFIDPTTESLVVKSFKAHHNCPVMCIEVRENANCIQLFSIVNSLDGLVLKLWDYENLSCLFEVDIPQNYSTYSLTCSIYAFGFNDGMIHVKSYDDLTMGNSVVNLVNENDVTHHSGKVISVDVLEQKGLICSCGKDEFIRLWNKERILLQEIRFDSSLCGCTFLDKKGTVLFGFKSHLFVTPTYILQIPDSEEVPSDDCSEDSFVYEDPFIKKEGYRRQSILEPTMNNYLVPFPHLGLKDLWLLNRSFEEDDDDISEEDLSERNTVESSDESIAATEVYQTEYSGWSRSNSRIEFPTIGPEEAISDDSDDDVVDALTETQNLEEKPERVKKRVKPTIEEPPKDEDDQTAVEENVESKKRMKPSRSGFNTPIDNISKINVMLKVKSKMKQKRRKGETTSRSKDRINNQQSFNDNLPNVKLVKRTPAVKKEKKKQVKPKKKSKPDINLTAYESMNEEIQEPILIAASSSSLLLGPTSKPASDKALKPTKDENDVDEPKKSGVDLQTLVEAWALKPEKSIISTSFRSVMSSLFGDSSSEPSLKSVPVTPDPDIEPEEKISGENATEKITFLSYNLDSSPVPDINVDVEPKASVIASNPLESESSEKPGFTSEKMNLKAIKSVSENSQSRESSPELLMKTKRSLITPPLSSPIIELTDLTTVKSVISTIGEELKKSKYSKNIDASAMEAKTESCDQLISSGIDETCKQKEDNEVKKEEEITEKMPDYLAHIQLADVKRSDYQRKTSQDEIIANPYKLSTKQKIIETKQNDSKKVLILSKLSKRYSKEHLMSPSSSSSLHNGIENIMNRHPATSPHYADNVEKKSLRKTSLTKSNGIDPIQNVKQQYDDANHDMSKENIDEKVIDVVISNARLTKDPSSNASGIERKVDDLILDENNNIIQSSIILTDGTVLQKNKSQLTSVKQTMSRSTFGSQCGTDEENDRRSIYSIESNTRSTSVMKFMSGRISPKKSKEVDGHKSENKQYPKIRISASSKHHIDNQFLQHRFITPRNSQASPSDNVSNIGKSPSPDNHGLVTDNKLLKSNPVLFGKLSKLRLRQKRESMRPFMSSSPSPDLKAYSPAHDSQYHSGSPSNNESPASYSPGLYSVDLSPNRSRISIKSPINNKSSKESSNASSNTSLFKKYIYTDKSNNDGQQHITREERMKHLEQKLSGQRFRFYLKRSQKELDNDKVTLDFMKAKQQGRAILPVDKTSVSIPRHRNHPTIELEVDNELDKKTPASQLIK